MRILAATYRVLKKEVAAGRFREVVFYRINVVPITLAPLRGRQADIPPLAAHFLDRACQRLHTRRPRLTRDHLRELQQYDWPGNIREPKNVGAGTLMSIARHAANDDTTGCRGRA